eukprot:360562_1
MCYNVTQSQQQMCFVALIVLFLLIALSTALYVEYPGAILHLSSHPIAPINVSSSLSTCPLSSLHCLSTCPLSSLYQNLFQQLFLFSIHYHLIQIINNLFQYL